MSTQEHHDEYGEAFVAGLEWMWGEGFLSPGGEEEVARIVMSMDVVVQGCLAVRSAAHSERATARPQRIEFVEASG